MLSRLAICSLARLSSVAWSATTVIGWHCQKCPHQLLSCVSNADSAATVFPVCCRCQATQTVFKAQRCYVPHPQLCSTASVIVTSHWTQEITGVSKPKESNLLNLFLLRSLSLSLSLSCNTTVTDAGFLSQVQSITLNHAQTSNKRQVEASKMLESWASQAALPRVGVAQPHAILPRGSLVLINHIWKNLIF